jgi:organic hydroperoxide reductase OsmC/OhrA
VSLHTATIAWSRGDQLFSDGRYARAHVITFDGGVSLSASSAPAVVPAPLSKVDAADPEEMLVASLSSCHMLFFLDYARRDGFVVDFYVDRPEGLMGKDERGRISMQKVTLKPTISWAGAKLPNASEVAALHHKSHEACFIANSFRGDVIVE